MQTAAQRLLPLLVLLFFAFGCSLVNQFKKQIEDSQKPQVLTSTDYKSQLTVPGGWRVQKDLNDDAALQAANPFAEQYVIVISESKDDFGTQFGLDSYADVILQGAKKDVINPVISEVKTVTVGGYPAKQFEVEGEVDRIKAKWLYTLIDAPKNYHQILNWSLASRYDKNKPIFLEIVNSFKEIEGTLQPPPPAKSSD